MSGTVSAKYVGDSKPVLCGKVELYSCETSKWQEDPFLKSSAAPSLSAWKPLSSGRVECRYPFLLSSLHFPPPHQLLGQGHHWRSTKATLQLHCSTAIIQPSAGGWWEESQEEAYQSCIPGVYHNLEQIYFISVL